ncbi:Gfo/Idh/MocA family oxidoreductase [Candidatus Woesearchaeota archaeon]|nr:Gfo/Idh/MocA family oxidoreductase [Candidatus Woesearchaeota archaeon]
MSKPKLNVAMYGHGFMGRAHSNALRQVGYFFPEETPFEVVLHTVVGRREDAVEKFAREQGWQNWTTDPKYVFDNAEIHLVDVATSNDSHADIAVSALEVGKHTLTEKPLSNTLQGASRMVQAAKTASDKGVHNAVWHNYRFTPAVVFALLQFITLIGKILRFRAKYLQQWGDESCPRVWRFLKDICGSGAHGDLNAHIIDLFVLLCQDELESVSGGYTQTVWQQRPNPEWNEKSADVPKTLASDVDDISLFNGRSKKGLIATFEATRTSAGSNNDNLIEIDGTKGRLTWSLESLTELHWVDYTENKLTRGWKTIDVSQKGHPYVSNCWPEGHNIGYEHTFIFLLLEFLLKVAGQKPLHTDTFATIQSTMHTQRVLQASLLSAEQGGAKVDISSIN